MLLFEKKMSSTNWTQKLFQKNPKTALLEVFEIRATLRVRKITSTFVDNTQKFSLQMEVKKSLKNMS